jgi:hypothetical protein
MFPPEVEKKLIALAAQRSVDPASFVASFVEKKLNEELALSADAGDDDSDPNALSRAVAALLSRTPEEKRAARQKAIEESKPLIELPLDVSPFDVMPVVRGNETDAQVIQALKELS